jgi:light-regulated signal transduction histidine kinase (bacteriophytochrome)
MNGKSTLGTAYDLAFRGLGSSASGRQPNQLLDFTERLPEIVKFGKPLRTVSGPVGSGGSGAAKAQPAEDLPGRIRELEASVQDLECLSCGLVHDLRSPMLAIDGYASMLEQEYAERLDEDMRRYLRLIHERCQRVNRLIKGHLAYARLDAQPVDRVDVDMGQLARSASDDALSDHCGSAPQLIIQHLPAARGDPGLLYQAWLNLVGNAVKYSSKAAAPRIEIEGWENGAESVYLVRDNGAGFDMHATEDLFGLFKRLHSSRDYPGTGIGLAVVRRVVSGHQGRVWAEGEPSKGATFYFSLPRDGIAA